MNVDEMMFAGRKRDWVKAMRARLSAVEFVSGSGHGFHGKSQELNFEKFEGRVSFDARAIVAYREVMRLAMEEPRLLMEEVEMGASAVELLLTAGDWECGLDLLGLAPDGLCQSPLRGLGLTSCAQRGFMKGVGSGGAFEAAGVRMWSERVLGRGLGEVKLMALEEECELIMRGEQQWVGDERSGRVFRGYASRGGNEWGGETMEQVRGMWAMAQKRALERVAEPGEESPNRKARFL